MSKNKQTTKHNATVIRMQGGDTAVATPPERPDQHVGKPAANNSRPPDNTNWSLDTGQARALTQIYHSLEASNNSVGFEVARQAANIALANNKIILNNRFVLDSIIGSGGMGTVYKARDLRKMEADAMDPHVAVKVLNDDFHNHPDALITLQREANKSQILAHPNIVSVHDFDRDGSIIYMTMELLDGVDVEHQVKRYAGIGLKQAEAFKIIKDFCAALIYAHQKNIIHSDLKPSNIFITKDGAKVLDFGIARITANAPKQDHFDAGSLGALTPAYASLEMLNREPPDQRDDVYAAAVIAYELLTGKHPFDQKDAQKALYEKLKPERISGLTNRQWQALESGLKLRRAERTATVQQFLDGLTYVRKNTWLKLAALPLLAVTAALGYYGFVMPNRLSQGVDSTIQKGLQCLQQKDFPCAQESANTVLKLDPQNQAAKSLLQQSNLAYQQSQEKKYVDAAYSCITSNNLECAKTNLAALKQAFPNSSLAAEIQTKIDLSVAQNNATRCYAEQNYDCALTNSKLILEKDPANVFATDMAQRLTTIQANQQAKVELNNKKYADAIAAAETCLGKKDYDCGLNLAKQALGYKPNDTSATKLAQTATAGKQQQLDAKFNEHLTSAKTCFGKQDYDCSIQLANQALVIKPTDAKATALIQQATAAKAQILEAKYTESISSAENCLDKKDFDCSIRNSQQALALKSGDPKATALAQKATGAKNQQMETMNKAKGSLDEGLTCFKNKDYKCAIAKSEAALQLVPEYKEAIDLKQSAEKEKKKSMPVFSDDYY
jgi:serine/threonine protein kinase